MNEKNEQLVIVHVQRYLYFMRDWYKNDFPFCKSEISILGVIVCENRKYRTVVFAVRPCPRISVLSGFIQNSWLVFYFLKIFTSSF